MFVVFDLETTGYSGITDDCVQFAYAMFDDRNMLVKAETLYFYYEGMSWSEEAYRVHGISQEFLKQHEADFSKNLVKMWTVLSGANVCGHNAKNFDCTFAVNWLSRFGLTGLSFGIIQDTMLAFRPKSKRPKISLIKLCDLCLITPEAITNLASQWFPSDENEFQSHNAAYDVTATAMLTLMGLRLGYITFDPSVALNMSLSSVDMSLLDTSDENNKQPLPDSNKVYFTLVDKDGNRFNHQFVCDKELYGDDSSVDEASLEFPGVLTQVSDLSVYAGEYNGCAFQLDVNKDGDVFTVRTDSASLVTPSFDLRKFVEGLLMRGGLHV